MKLKFETLYITNFKTFIGEHTFDLRALGPGLHFLCGDNQAEPSLESNGAGKTSLIDAFRWCLTGRSSNDLKGPDIRPWEEYGVDDQTMVELEFTLGDEVPIRTITRCAGPNSLTLDGKDCDQYEIDNLIRLSDDVIANTILFGQGKPLFFDLPPGEKLGLFSTVLNLDRWDDYADRASAAGKKAEEQKRTGEGRRLGLDSEIQNLTTSIEDLRVKVRTWGTEKVEKLRGLQVIKIREQAQLDAARENYLKLKLTADGAGMEIEPLRNQVDEAGNEVLRLSSEENQVKVAIQVAEAEYKRLQAELTALGDAEDCPTCGQSLKGTNLARHKKDLRLKIGNTSRELGQGRTTLAANSQMVAAQMRRDNLRDKLREHEQKEDAARTSCDQLNTNIGRFSAVVASTEASIAEIDKSTNPHDAQLQTARARKTAVEKDLELLNASIEVLAQTIERMTFWARGFKEVRLLLVDDVLKELELVSNDMLQDVGLGAWNISYSVEKATKSGTTKRALTVMIHSPKNKHPVRWEAFSGGERQRLRLVGSLALGEVLLNHAGVSPNIEILDEPSQHLATKGVKDLCTYLAWRAEQQGKIIFLVDHQAVSSEDFTSTVTVVRDKQGSRIVL